VCHSFGGHQRLLARARLQCDLGGVAEELLVARLACRIQHDLVRSAGLAAAQFDLADEQLVEELRVEGGPGGWLLL
jgi:hypothetical protein